MTTRVRRITVSEVDEYPESASEAAFAEIDNA